MDHRVSIIVPTFNRPVVLQATIDQVLAQPFSDYELWIVDQSDPDAAASNLDYVTRKQESRLHYLHLADKGLPNARNEGLARISGEIVIFLDDDVLLLSEDFIGAHLVAYDDPTIGGVVGRHVERSLKMNTGHTACHVSWTGRTIFNLFGTERTFVGSVKGSNMSFRMDVVRQIGGFDRRTHMLEETDFSTRARAAGWKILFEPKAEIVHLSTQAGGVRQKNRLGTEARRFRSTAYYVLKHRGFLGTPGFLGMFFLIALHRTVRMRSLDTLRVLYQAVHTGFAEAMLPPDEVLPRV
ncbi:MAG: glycosyltransferase family 2 protein [Acidocella sp.]|nr:glycosyltransferase family 2 protein [Acidocella sp.]